MLRRAVAMGGLAVVLLGCSKAEPVSVPATTVFGGNVTRPGASGPAGTQLPDTAGLGALIPTVNGFTRVDGPSDGAFDANTGALRFASNDADARQRLATGLVGGYAARFQGEGNSASGVQLYQFKDQAGAEDFAQYLKDHAMQGIENFNLTVPGVPDVTGFLVRRSSGGTGAGALFVKGPYLAYVGSSSPTTDVTGLVRSLTTAQYEKLP